MHKFRVQTSGFISAFYSRGWICRWFSGFNPVDGCSRSSLEVSLLDVPLADASSSIAGFRFGSFWLQFCFYDFYFFSSFWEVQMHLLLLFSLCILSGRTCSVLFFVVASARFGLRPVVTQIFRFYSGQMLFPWRTPPIGFIRAFTYTQY